MTIVRTNIHRFAWAFLLALALIATRGALAAQPAAQAVGLVDLDGSVNPGSTDFLLRAMDEASSEGLQALVIRIDTPGGMLESTRSIVKAELASKIPIIVWVGPAGARAGSAGVFITYGAHVAAMAPATNIGAAHPVAAGANGAEKMDDTMAEKVTNDLVAWAQGIAKQRNRSAEWVEEAVRKSVSVPAEEALKLHVIDLISPDLPSLLKEIDGRKVTTAAGEITLATAQAQLKPLKMTPREKLLDFLGDPSIAFLFIGLGALGILAELYHPGTVFPGVLGAVSLSLGLVATRMLPVRAGSIVLILVGAGLLAAEFYVTSYGLLAVAGLACFALGAFLLINPSEPGFMVDRDFGVAWAEVLPIVLAVAAVLALVVWKVTQSRMRKQITGAAGLVGEEGIVSLEVGPAAGKVLVHGEIWEARSPNPIAAGERVRVEQIEGLLIRVAPAKNLSGELPTQRQA